MAFAVSLALLVAQATLLPSPKARTFPATPATEIRGVPIQAALSSEREIGARIPQVTVQVTVATNGSVKAARVWKSSGYRDYDIDALRSAEAGHYRPATVNCQPVEKSILVDFVTAVTY